MGRREDALRIIRSLEARRAQQWIDPVFIASAYDGLPDPDGAMRWLERAFEERAFLLRSLIAWDTPLLRNVRKDPRYAALMRTMKLPM